MLIFTVFPSPRYMMISRVILHARERIAAFPLTGGTVCAAITVFRRVSQPNLFRALSEMAIGKYFGARSVVPGSWRSRACRYGYADQILLFLSER